MPRQSHRHQPTAKPTNASVAPGGDMTRRYLPDDQALAAALAGRIDVLERQLRQTTGDVTALGRGVSTLSSQIRDLATNLTPTAAGTGDGPGNGELDEDGDGQEVTGQPDWFTVTDPDEAAAILTTLNTWVQEVGVHHGITVPVPCWGLHPDVVTDLLALSTERISAYTNPHPTPVSEWLTRWLPAATERISSALTPCARERGHRDNGITYDTSGFDPYSAGPWWALDRETPAPTAFALTRLH
jgi:hypothetical protein